MCGLTGFFALNNTRSRSEISVIGRKMTKSLSHRGPDSGDQWQDPDLPLLLGHRRLSILDLTSEGAQPMESESRRYIIIYNGEIYNHLQLRFQLEDEGANFRGRSDTETILAAIEIWGLNQALQKISGMFAFALWDRRDRALHFARDRLGKKPLYFGWAGGGKNTSLIFASELKALHEHPDFKPEINQQTLSLFLRYGFVPAPNCIYKNIWQLPPAYRLSLSLNDLKPLQSLTGEMQTYWAALEVNKIARNHQSQKPENRIIDDFEKALSESVKRRLISDVPLGAFLSGGIDSSTVTALMQSLSPRPVKTFTIAFEQKEYNEADHARAIAHHLGTEHQEHLCTPHDALDVIPDLPDIYDEPFADQSAIPTYLVSKFTRKEVTVALSGDGGDELLGGYTRHVSGPKIAKINNILPGFMRTPMAKTITCIPPERWQALKPYKPLFGQHMHKLAAALASNNEAALYTSLLSQWQKPPTAEKNVSPHELPPLEAMRDAERLMLWDMLTYLPGDILTKVDRASMAVSLEARAPLLDYRLFEYVWSLPLSMKIRNGRGKYLLRQVLRRHIPDELFNRPKQGFNIPVDAWLRGPLRDWAEDLLDEKALDHHGLLDKKTIRYAWAKHLKGQGHHTGALWTVLMFQAWYKRWM